MPFPMLEINTHKIRENTKIMVNECHKRGIEVAGVSKVFSGNRKIIEALIDGGIDILADSRIENLIRYRNYNIPKMLLRIPMKSQAKMVVKYSDIALVSEIQTIKELDKYAMKENKIYKVILMIDLGDLREGIFFKNETEILDAVEEILELNWIEFYGIGTNLSCYGGVIPTNDNLSKLVEIKKKLEKTFNIDIKTISGGNSGTISLFKNNDIPKEINQLRLGASLALGIGLNDEPIEGLHNDTVKLIAEIVEVKKKPSVPVGEIGLDAFGRKPFFEDKGIRKRAICAIGKQDINPEHLSPYDNKITVLGASSDHLILDITESDENYKVGDKVEFKVTYGGLLSLMTSKYVYKKII